MMNFDLKTGDVSNGFYLALVYLVISGNYLGNLFGCRIQQLFRENMWIKHLLGLFTTYFLIILSTPPADYGSTATMVLTGAVYAWFFLTTKMHVSFWIPMILAVLGAYFLYVYMKQQKDKGEAGDKDEARKAWLQTIQSVAVLFAGVLTVVGVVAYYGEKKIEYGDMFSAWTFWSGVPECKYQTPPATITESLVAAFTA